MSTIAINVLFVFALICFAIGGIILFLEAWSAEWLSAHNLMFVTGLVFTLIALVVKYGGTYL